LGGSKPSIEIRHNMVKDMANVKEIRGAASPSWLITLASLLPLWLLSVSVMAEGFPRPPISIELARVSFVFAIFVSIVLLWKRWMTVELILYGLMPFVLLYAFDEISTTYKTPFIILCTLILTVGIAGYQRYRSTWWRWPILLFAGVATLMMAWHANLSFWQMADDLGYIRCLPDAHGCAPLTGQETPWWILFF
jgi:hypothetical protein